MIKVARFRMTNPNPKALLSNEGSCHPASITKTNPANVVSTKTKDVKKLIQSSTSCTYGIVRSTSNIYINMTRLAKIN